MTALLEVEDVYAGYGPGGDILQGVDLRMEKGDYLCIIGPNGAGKSTLMRVIAGVLSPRKGRVMFEGHDISGRRPDLVFRDGIVTVPQGRNTFPDMTVWENMLMGAYSVPDRQLVKQRIDRVMELLPVVAEKRNARAGLLSGGQQKQVEIGRAMLVDPKLLILDEPTMGLEPRIARIVLERVERLRQGGTTILMVEQNARLGLAAAQDGCVMELGRIKLRGRGVEMLDDPEVSRLYLGEEAGADNIGQLKEERKV
ncbi:MAG: ABC transporter ATP-binding protein [Candidatus Dormibacteraeota bacterium]|nr:ABC transporter ATP-binding protein [Candidatus Dormibacteraeota bacterium]